MHSAPNDIFVWFSLSTCNRSLKLPGFQDKTLEFWKNICLSLNSLEIFFFARFCWFITTYWLIGIKNACYSIKGLGAFWQICTFSIFFVLMGKFLPLQNFRIKTFSNTSFHFSAYFTKVEKFFLFFLLMRNFLSLQNFRIKTFSYKSCHFWAHFVLSDL